MKTKSSNEFSIAPISISVRLFMLLAILFSFAIGCKTPDPHSTLSNNFAKIKLDRELEQLLGRVYSVSSVEIKNNSEPLYKLKTYDVQGNCVTFAYGRSKDGKLVYDTILTRACTYDSSGRITKSSTFFSGQHTAATTIYKYDQYGNPLEENTFDHSIKFKYHKMNNRIEMTRARGTRFLDKTIFDKRGKEIEYSSERIMQTFNKSGKVMNHYEKDGDGNHRLIVVYSRNKNGLVTNISYPQKDESSELIYSSFDSAGNWIERKWITRKADVFDTTVTKREITYSQ